MNEEIKPFLHFSAAELHRMVESENAIRQALPLWDINHPKGFLFDVNEQAWLLYWSGCKSPYPIELSQINSQLELIQFLYHIGEKQWIGMNGERIRYFISSVFTRKNWILYPQLRKSSNVEERKKLTTNMRYQVLVRGNFTCIACGNRPEHGAVLHVDHIQPIATGGKTELDNLQVLCAACNFGKRDK